MDFASKFDEGLTYTEFLQKHGNDEQRRRWDAVHAEVRLTDAQQAMLAAFAREMKVLVVAGAWCGDCVHQCPIFDHFSRQNERIRIRFFDRDTHPDLADALSICGARRVPSVLFLSEDNFECGRYGDRTLTRYREIAHDKLGGVCSTGLVPHEQPMVQNVVQEWLNEFERIQLMLRTSARLREKHGD